MFVGRETELNTLEKLYKKNGFQLVVLYGRRRIGKTTLINKFIMNKPNIFFVAQEANDFMNLEILSRKIYEFFGMPSGMGGFRSWQDAFDFLAEKALEKRFILAIDEFPYAVEENRSIKSILQNVIDHKLKNTSMFIILCGSHMSFMENEVLGYKSPLFGRRTAQIKLESFDYIDSSKLISSYSNEDKVRFYSCIGGTPHYLSQIDTSESFEDNIKDLYFNISGYLYDEPMMLLQQELRVPAMYNSIITAIASGCSRLNEISTKINEESSKTIKYLNTLIELKIIHKEYPFGEDIATSRKGVYRISDYCYNFWYRYVFPNKPGIEQGAGNLIAEIEVFPKLSEYIGKPAFEEICRQYVIRQNKVLQIPFIATSFGSWWGNDSKEKKQADIDVITANKNEKKIILGECKWKNQYNDFVEIQKLMDKTYLFPEYKEFYFMFFSKIPFSVKAKDLEKEIPNLTLVDLDMLFKA